METTSCWRPNPRQEAPSKYMDDSIILMGREQVAIVLIRSVNVSGSVCLCRASCFFKCDNDGDGLKNGQGKMILCQSAGWFRFMEVYIFYGTGYLQTAKISSRFFLNTSVFSLDGIVCLIATAVSPETSQNESNQLGELSLLRALETRINGRSGIAREPCDVYFTSKRVHTIILLGMETDALSC